MTELDPQKIKKIILKQYDINYNSSAIEDFLLYITKTLSELNGPCDLKDLYLGYAKSLVSSKAGLTRVYLTISNINSWKSLFNIIDVLVTLKVFKFSNDEELFIHEELDKSTPFLAYIDYLYTEYEKRRYIGNPKENLSR